MRRSLVASFSTSLLLQIIGACTGIILARALHADGRGELAAAMLWPSLIGAVATLGIEESATYHIAREPGAAGRVVGSGAVLALTQALAATALCAALIPLVLHRHPHTTMVTAWIYLGYIPINALNVLCVGVLNGGQRPRAFNLLRLSAGVFPITTQIVLLSVGSLTVRHMVIGYVASWGACTLLGIALVRDMRAGPLHADRATMQSLFGYGVRSHASTVPSQLNQRLDQLLISVFLSARQLGLYVVATTLSSLTALVGGSVAYAALPAVARLPPGPERTRLACRLVGWTLVASAIVALPVVLATPWLLKLLFGSGFGSAVDVSRVLAVATVSFSTTRAMEAVLRAVGQPLQAGVAEIVALGTTVVSLAVLLPAFGITGAGLASLLAYTVAAGWMVRRVARALDAQPRDILIPDRESLRLLWNAVRTRSAGRTP